MTKNLRAEPPTVLSIQIERAISSYIPPGSGEVGPTLGNHVSDQLLSWLSSSPSHPYACDGNGTQRLTCLPTTDEALRANAMEGQPSPSLFGSTAAALRATREFHWPTKLDLAIGGGGVVLAQLLGMDLTIWETGDWQLNIGFTTFAKVRFKIDVALCQEVYRGLCAVSTDWRTQPSTNGMPDCLSWGGSSTCIGEFYSVISYALRSTDASGPL